MHLDPPLGRVVERLVPEAACLEVRAQLAVDAREQVQVEARGHPFRVGVGRVQGRLVLLQVDADEQRAACADRAVDLPEEAQRLGGREVADGRAREESRLAPDRHPRERGQRERPRVVGADADDVQPGEAARELLRRGLERAERDVDRHVQPRLQRLDQDARLRLHAAAVLDQLRVGPDELHDVGDVAAQPGDPLEKEAVPQRRRRTNREVVAMLACKADLELGVLPHPH